MRRCAEDERVSEQADYTIPPHHEDHEGKPDKHEGLQEKTLCSSGFPSCFFVEKGGGMPVE
jgi:hypothetical protein